MRFTLGLALLLCGWCVPALDAADVFDRHALPELRKAIEGPGVTTQITLNDVAKIKPLSPLLSSPCVAIKTNSGNYAKALLGWGLRKGSDKPTPVVVIERFVTYRVDRPDLTTAASKDVMLFPGFGFNFDIGQVVPVDQGADVEFTAEGAFKPVGEAVLAVINGSMLAPPEAGAKHDPFASETIVPLDYAGSWKVDVDGRWKGEWDLKVDHEDRISGVFLSDELQNRYEVLGQVGQAPHQLKLTITLANTHMLVDACLWTKDKSRMAGTVTMAGRKFGFVAERGLPAP